VQTSLLHCCLALATDPAALQTASLNVGLVTGNSQLNVGSREQSAGGFFQSPSLSFRKEILHTLSYNNLLHVVLIFCAVPVITKQ